MIVGFDHIQLAHPAGSEAQMREFYCGILGMTEVEKPVPLQGRGGFWADANGIQIHFGVDPAFTPATKAHPAFIVADLGGLAARLAESNSNITWDTSLPDVKRFFTNDPVGNRVELIEQR